MKTTYIISLVLVVIGALNWGLVGLFNYDLVAAIFGEMEPITRIIYVVVGIAGIVVAATAAPLLQGETASRHQHPAG